MVVGWWGSRILLFHSKVTVVNRFDLKNLAHHIFLKTLVSVTMAQVLLPLSGQEVNFHISLVQAPPEYTVMKEEKEEKGLYLPGTECHT